MNFMASIDIKPLDTPVKYGDKLFLIGSCFTEHIGNALGSLKYNVLQNPNGILFDPASVVNSIISYIDNRQYETGNLFLLNEVYNSWAHHSRFSHIDAATAIQIINDTQNRAHAFLKEADWVIITLGSSFSYRLQEEAVGDRAITGLKNGVANCHRAPQQWFHKHLLEIEETVSLLDTCYHRIKKFNPKAKIIFTVSPVRHLRDGVVANNRSKARLIEAVHHMVNKFTDLYYFPAYELVIDVLRDYRFYDIDFAHPNYQATEYVMQQFTEHYIDKDSQTLMQQVKQLVIASNHKAFQPETNAHRQFLNSHAAKAKALQEAYPFLNFAAEIDYFEKAVK
jgi:hypothetical protein